MKIINFEDHLEEPYSDKSNTFVQELENEGINSARAVACKKQNYVKVSTRYISSKLLINARYLLQALFTIALIRFVFQMRIPLKSMPTKKLLRYYHIF